MKIKVPESVLKDHSRQCWQYVADTVDSRMNARRAEGWTESLSALVRKTCGEVYSHAMNGGDGRPLRATQGSTSIEVCMGSVREWTVEIFGRVA